MQIFLKYPAVFVIGFTVTYVLTPYVRRLACRVGIVDLPGARRIHTRPTPRGGGIALFVGFHATCAAVFLLPWKPFDGILDIAWWLSFLPKSALLLLIGLFDDYRGLKPPVKLAGQLTVAVLFVLAGTSFGSVFGYDLPYLVDFSFTVIWLLAFVNAFNLIDGLDGLAVGLGLIAAIGMSGALLLRHLPGDALLLLGLTGACAAFLRYNFHPASIFLGDSGSMFLGLALASVALSTGSRETALASIGVPLLAVGVPVFDVMLAVWRRSVRRMASSESSAVGNDNRIMRADMEHLHHRLLNAGFSQKGAAAWLYVLNALLVLTATLSLIFSASAVGIFLLAFVAGSYVVVRHLAKVELWDSGVGLLSGLRRPPRRTIAVLLYPILDVCILTAALGLAIAVLRPDLNITEWKQAWLSSFPVWIGIPFIAVFVANTYRRVWSRARVTDFVMLAWALLLGMCASLGVTAISSAACTRYHVSTALLLAAFAVPPILGIRGFSIFLHDVMSVMDRVQAKGEKEERRDVIICGGGTRCTQFLRNRRYAVPYGKDDQRIVGIVDNDSNLRDRFVYGYRVLGGFEDLPDILEKSQVDEVLIATDLNEETRSLILQLACENGLTVSEWLMKRRIILDPRETEHAEGNRQSAESPESRKS